MDDAVAAVQASLEPSRRNRCLPPAIDAIELIADRRALAQILARALGSAARVSRHDDWIDVSLDMPGNIAGNVAANVPGDRFTRVIADEGNGLVATDGVGPLATPTVAALASGRRWHGC